MKKNLLYAITSLCFCIMIGGAVYEHLSVVPQWTAAPPVSLSMFQGTYGVKPEIFWKLIHPVNLLLFIITLAVHWKSERRINILTIVAGYVLILGITAIYFVPELLFITKTAYTQIADPELTNRAKAWELWSLVRLAFLLVMASYLLMGLTKPGSPIWNIQNNKQRKQAGNRHERESALH